MDCALITLKKCPHYGQKHQGLTIRSVLAGTQFKGKTYYNLTHFPKTFRRIYLNLDYPQPDPNPQNITPKQLTLDNSNYLKYNTFYQDTHHYRNVDIIRRHQFRAENFSYNREKDEFICPVKQRLHFTHISHPKTDNGY